MSSKYKLLNVILLFLSAQKRPCKALTDQQYDLIFQAVLSKYPCDEDSESSNQKADQTDTVNESFQLSQSDIEDDTEVRYASLGKI